ncbi:Nucleoside-diphosphate-sugar epimerases [Lentimonas sp. CC19]|nr:Nucleoside-diphosphate-sugar epimerases [Lentimonas sp. CC4]CAA6685815.1 Nucleoside-diphosphate-sugar epimerases [Lentimonas sp. CC6]CAA6693551.1 Nucleoside-diphosphate-sugar epimerases [Lentimonas sp. CC19]CAA6695878.1 Nucleoside-diphosphate-sugar epimerases [Lentimonas sp. CC10]CAA7069797.1 Nucleoside-diphosphate-sugar epimerases [Lentimonas sp. CC11]CAA7171955.1 Nucleoside-diphosphate-sugar epimerases [Lentimonas sp. CC21]CAA7181544.1 Nucleoside-diphosphate-sugar epimerases [Lentimonas 
MIFGCGYVGTALAKVLLSNGVRVGALTRNAEKALALRDLGLSEVVVADLSDEAWHAQLSASYESVVNCVSSAGGGIAGYRKSYLEGQLSILKWAQGRAIQSYLYTSSTSVYPQDGGVSVDETADTSEAPATGQVLRESEQLLADAGDAFGAWYVLRLAGIYGPKRHYLLDMLRSGESVIPGVGDYFLNLIHRDDIVGAICTAIAQPQSANSGIYNVADNHPSTKAELVGWLAEQLQQAPPRFDPDHVSPRLQRRGGRMPSRAISNLKLRQSLGWSPHYEDFRAGYAGLLK